MKVFFNSNVSSSEEGGNIFSVDVFLKRDDIGSFYRIELIIVKIDGTIDQKEIFRTKNKNLIV